MFETNSGAMGLRYLQNPGISSGEEIVRKGKKYGKLECQPQRNRMGRP